MSGKHDKSVDDEQSPNLLLTGPIAIRGLGRGVKDALVRGAPSRHRAFAGDPKHDVDPTPVQRMLATGPTVAETGPSSELAEHAGTQEAGEAPASFLSDTTVPETDDGPQEDRVDDPAEHDAPDDDDAAAQPHDEASTADPEVVDDPAASQDEPGERPAEPDVDAGSADAVEATAVEASGFDEFDALPPEPVVGDTTVGTGTEVDLEEPGAARAVPAEPEFDDSEIDDEGSSDAAPATDDPAFDDFDEEASEPGGTSRTEAPADEPDRAVDESAFDEFDALPPADAADLIDEAVASESGHDPLAAPTEGFGDGAPVEEVSESADDAGADRVDGAPAPDDRITLLEAERAQDPEPLIAEEPEDGATDVEGAEEAAVTVQEPDGLANASEQEAVAAPETSPKIADAAVSESDDSTAAFEQRDDDDVAVEKEREQPHTAAPGAASGPEDETPNHGGAPETDPASGETVLDAPPKTADAPTTRRSSEIPPGPADTADEPQEHKPADGSLDAADADDSERGDADATDEHVPQDHLEPAPEDTDDLDDRPAVHDGVPEAPAAAPAAAEGPWTSAERLFSLPPHDEEDDRGAAETPDARSLESDGDHEAGEQPVDHDATSEPALEPADGPEPAVQPEPDTTAEPEPVVTRAPEQEPARDSDAAGDVTEQRPVAETAAPAAVMAAAPPTGPRPPVARSSSSSRPPNRRPLRERFGREAIGIAVLVVLALICAGLITAVVVKTRNDAAIAAREAADYTPPPLATPEPAKTGPVVAVIGDGSTSAAGSGVTAKQRWTAQLESSLGGTVDADAAGGMGYAAKSRSGDTFVQAASAVPSDAKVVVFFGGAADSNIAPLSLAKAATNAYAAAMKRAPEAKILVVGPAISSGAGTTDLAAIRDTLRGAAAVVQATWIDPIDEDWLPASKRSASPGDLTASDEKAIASKMQDAVEKALR